jgi:hypothetical protein
MRADQSVMTGSLAITSNRRLLLLGLGSSASTLTHPARSSGAASDSVMSTVPSAATARWDAGEQLDGLTPRGRGRPTGNISLFLSAP